MKKLSSLPLWYCVLIFGPVRGFGIWTLDREIAWLLNNNVMPKSKSS